MEKATWARTTTVIEGAGDAPPVTYERARFVLRDGAARLFDNNGVLLAHGAVDYASVARASAIVRLVDGFLWTVEKARGCGCGR